MIKLELLPNGDGTIRVILESNSQSQDALRDLDAAYSLLLSGKPIPKQSGYVESNICGVTFSG